MQDKFIVEVNGEEATNLPCSSVVIRLGNEHPIMLSIAGFASFDRRLKVGDIIVLTESGIILTGTVAEVLPTFILCDLI